MMRYQGAKSTGATVEPCFRPDLSNLSMTKSTAKHRAAHATQPFDFVLLFLKGTTSSAN